MKNLLLLLIAISLCALIFPIALLYAILTRGFNSLGRDSWATAIAIDQVGNVWCKHLFNDLMVRPNGFPFGNPNFTVSHVLGMNKSMGTLYPIGIVLCNILDKIDKDHTAKAKDNEQ